MGDQVTPAIDGGTVLPAGRSVDDVDDARARVEVAMAALGGRVIFGGDSANEARASAAGSMGEKRPSVLERIAVEDGDMVSDFEEFFGNRKMTDDRIREIRFDD